LKKIAKLVSCLVGAGLIYSATLFATLADQGSPIPAKRIPTTLLQDAPLVQSQLVQWRPQDPELSRHLRNYDLIKMDRFAAATQIRNRGQLLLKTSRQDFDLQLAPNDLRSPDYSAQVIGADGGARKLQKVVPNTFKGTVKGNVRAQVRMAVSEGSLEGVIITETNRYFIQPARALSRAAKDDEFVFYEASELSKDASSCGVTLAEEVAAREALSNPQGKTELTSEANSLITPVAPLKVVRLATDADAEYVAALGGAPQANAQIMNIMNMVDGIYQVEIGVTFQIVFQNAWSDSASDPYTSTVPSTLLSEFRNRWNANPPSQGVTRSLAHLWTGKDLDGSVIGVASLAVTCRSPSFSYGLSQLFPFNSPGNPITGRTAVLTAHEIGHNFSASHTNQATPETPPDVERACDNTIMEASVGDGSSFCPFSRSQMVGHANAYSSCLLDSPSGPPSFPPCVETPLPVTRLVSNTPLSSDDCRSPSRGVRFFADRYSFNGTAGERLSVSMFRILNNTLDPYLYLIGPDGYVIAQDDDSASPGGQDAQIPRSGDITLPLTGKYILEATSFEGQQTGNYAISMNLSGCSLSVSPTSLHFPVAGGDGTINVTTTGSCSGYQFGTSPNIVPWLTPSVTSGSGSRAFQFSVNQNTGTAGRRAFLLVGATLPDFFGGLQIPITQSGTTPDCTSTPIVFGQTVSGSLITSDCESPVRGNGYFADRYTFNVVAGQQAAITLTSSNAPATDTFLTLIGPNGVVLSTDDDSGGLTNSRIPGGTGMLPLGLSGTYTIEVTGFSPGETGPYSLNLTGIKAPVGPIQIILDESGPDPNQATALDSILFLRDPFPVVNVANLLNPGFDRNTRLIILVTNLELLPGETSSAVVVNLVDSNNQSYTFAAEDLRVVPNFNFSQVTFRLPDNLPPGVCTVKVTAHNQVSNVARIRIRI
jgi:hypothetical protein